MSDIELTEKQLPECTVDAVSGRFRAVIETHQCSFAHQRHGHGFGWNHLELEHALQCAPSRGIGGVQREVTTGVCAQSWRRQRRPTFRRFSYESGRNGVGKVALEV